MKWEKVQPLDAAAMALARGSAGVEEQPKA